MKLKLFIVGFLLNIGVIAGAYEPVTVDFSDGSKTYQVTFDSPPKRAVTTSHFMTEMLLSLGLEDSMAGSSWADNEILPELQEAYNKVPILSKRYPSKEVLYSVEPDFISGWHSSLNPKRLAGVDELMENGITPYIITSLEKEATMEEVYEDYYTLGRIFDVREEAHKVVEELKKSVVKADNIHRDTKNKRVLAYDSGRETPYVVAGSGLGNNIITLAGGDNIFSDINGNYAMVSWEAVLERDPEIILIVNYGGENYQEKIKFFKENDFTRELDAVQNNNFVVVNLADISPGPRVGKALEKMSKEFFERGK